MSVVRHLRRHALVVALVAPLALLTACEDETGVEEAGEELGEAVEDVGEGAGEAIEDAGEAAEERAD